MPPTDPTSALPRDGLGPFDRTVLRRIPWLLVPWFAVLFGAAAVLHLRDRERDRTLGLQRSVGVVELHAEIVERELQWASFAILDLARDRLVVEHFSREDRREEIGEAMRRFCEVSGVFDQVRLLDANGDEVVRVNYDEVGGAVVVPRDQLQNKSDRYYVERAQALPPGAVYVSPFDLNVEHGAVEVPWKPVVRIATRCYDATGEPRGLVVLNYLGAPLLDQLRRTSASAPGWSALVDDAGYFLEAPDELPSWGFLFDEPPTFARTHPGAWQRMGAAEEGTFEAERSLYTFRRLAPKADLVRAGDRIDLDLRTLVAIPFDVLHAESYGKLVRMGWAGAIVALLLVATAWRLAFVAAVRRGHERRLVESERQLSRLSKRLLEVQEEERHRLSRDLHDDLGQLATAMSIDLGRALRLEDDAAKDEAIQRARDGSTKLLTSVRRIAASLRSSPLEDLGFEAALRQLIGEVEERTGVRVRMDVEVGDDELSSAVGVHLFRVVQEGVSNALKHAGATAVRVSLRRDGDLAVLAVEDEGRGFDPTRPNEGLGLLGMHERIDLLGGRLRIDSVPGRGTTIEATVPLDAPGAEGARGRTP